MQIVSQHLAIVNRNPRAPSGYSRLEDIAAGCKAVSGEPEDIRSIISLLLSIDVGVGGSHWNGILDYMLLLLLCYIWQLFVRN